MSKFIILALLAVVVTTPVTSRRNSHTDSSFVTAQSYCPNRRC
jgi:hypothetical protein